MNILGIEDGKLPEKRPRRGRRALLVGVKLSDMRIVEVLSESIEVDGLDATEKASKIVRKCLPLDLILLGGISFAGFNLIDAVELWRKFNVPVVVASKDKPNNIAVLSALQKHFSDWEERWRIIEKVIEASNGIHEVIVKPEENPLYVEVIGISIGKAEEILRKITVWGRSPEPLRIANIIAKGLSPAYFTLKNKFNSN
ncbi:MAG: hypothetical protein DRJ26_01020 [Candidatus Methanomethylicota archaeon]|uniref:UPF0215 protein DRJ26_01020 n=1 Tax=Thermoproteota archaeon TaxID=2056631 RepID=A0A497F7A5_9CREN|nr:MAG: hypothetical protein DRJ26_01020 [Candidatus Verstraetearchaeota archaeon]